MLRGNDLMQPALITSTTVKSNCKKKVKLVLNKVLALFVFRCHWFVILGYLSIKIAYLGPLNVTYVKDYE